MYKKFFKSLKVFSLLSFILFTTTTQVHAQPRPSHFDPSDPAYNHVGFLIEDETLHTIRPLPYSAVHNYGPFMRYYIENPQMTIRFNIEGGGSEDILLQPLVDEAATYWNEILRDQGLTIAPLPAGGGIPNFIIRTVPNSYFSDVLHTPESMATTYEAGYRELRELNRRYPFITSAGIYLRESDEITNEDLQQLETNFGTNDRRVLLENLTYTLILHEFGHAVGLSHPRTSRDAIEYYPPPRERWHVYDELGVASLEPLQDRPQPGLMENFQFEYLQALYLYNQPQYQHLARHMIHLSDGERLWIQGMVSCTRRYDPPPIPH
ncbi:hypothetical protein [Xenorhabdus griffiniae]|uniref:Peptidase M10 metallopeptidase domain-containing protein n=1 Tax=Xenorhabdus griffiniae TaxID=351672 RepID=A0ABY9XD06_9GAMM|nr:hypothetical protein [Xenorhabdus griffiniae]MBD1227837.1 hypothetical protein [Xenorhabdus griffiniae]MBE8588624.1 hypothetical protein [Xenorhabdus griffiniae]WMV70810.1 hypothetical protein QL128_11255 [Xenorhabdus griffiniae]WNH00486.1 hypothetical protein QL112_011260 [Xenorhabdus griffiniae]